MAQTGVKVQGNVYSRASAEIALVDGTIYDNIQGLDWDHALTPGVLRSKGRKVGRTKGDEEIGEVKWVMPLKDFFDMVKKLTAIGGTTKGYKQVEFPISCTWFEPDEDAELKVEIDGVRVTTDAFSLEEGPDPSLVEVTGDAMSITLFEGTQEIVPVR